MKCPNCNANQTFKKGDRRGRQCYKCKHCGRQFLDSYRSWRYLDDVKQLCIKMYLNGMGLRGTLARNGYSLARASVMHWIREAGHEVSDAPEANELPEITDLYELQTFVGNKRHKVWIWTAVNHSPRLLDSFEFATL